MGPGYISNHMVTHRPLDEIFGALSDRTRRAILVRLAEADASVGELAEPFEISRPAVSKHLRVLEAAGLVVRTKQGRMSRCSFDPAPLREAGAWVKQMTRFWDGQLDALETYLDDTTRQEES